MNQEKLKEEVKSKEGFAMDFSIDEKSGPLSLVSEGESQSDKQKESATQKYGFSIDNKEGNYGEIFKIKIDNLTEEEQAEVKEKTKAIKSDLFENSKDEFEFTSRLTRLNMNLSSQVGDNYNNLNKEIAKKTKISSSDDIAKEINNLNDVIKGYDMSGSTKNPVEMFLNVFRKAKRNKEIDSESIEDKIQVILEELIAKRTEQSDLLNENDKKVKDLMGFIKEINKTILVCKEILFAVEKKRMEIADKALNDGDDSPMLISNYKDIYTQEKSLENLIRNLLVVRLHLNASFNKNSDIRSTYQSVAGTINEVITFVIPSYRNLLIDYVTENKIEDTLKLIEMTKKARNQIESESHKNYQNIRLAANNLANESIYNIKTLEQSINIIIDTEKKIREADEKAKVSREEDIKVVNELQERLNEYSIGKNELKRP
jgi:hypothetical protein